MSIFNKYDLVRRIEQLSIVFISFFRSLSILSVIRRNTPIKFVRVFLESKSPFRRKPIHSIRLSQHRVSVPKSFVIRSSKHGKWPNSKRINQWYNMDRVIQEVVGRRIDGEFEHCLNTIDPQTKRFLTESLDHIFGFPKFVRFSWSTASTIIEKSCMKISW